MSYFNVIDLDNENDYSLNFPRLPKECPNCHTKLNTKPLNCYKSNNLIFQVHFCPECNKIFISEFKNLSDPMLIKSYPQTVIKETFPQDIIKRSPKFFEIYNQAYQAEQENLLEICGMGYRKALEFLVKDYLISTFPEKEDDIKNSFLGNCIEKYITHPKIKACASRAVWLANDYSHYIKKHTDKDLSDLKNLIFATVSWINTEIITENALSIKHK